MINITADQIYCSWGDDITSGAHFINVYFINFNNSMDNWSRAEYM